MSDNLEQTIDNLYRERSPSLFDRYAGGPYRGTVVETNDPLQKRRVRVNVPDLYDSDCAPEEILWCGVAPWLGGKGSGFFSHPIIGDQVWVAFERGHPYGGIVIGFADASRRRFYEHQSLYGEPPIFFKADGDATQTDTDTIGEELKDFFPKDRRPMSTGFRDRYGNVMISSAVGYFPIEHAQAPAPPGVDALTQGTFNKADKPEVNSPDVKYMASYSKYGHLTLGTFYTISTILKTSPAS